MQRDPMLMHNQNLYKSPAIRGWKIAGMAGDWTTTLNLGSQSGAYDLSALVTHLINSVKPRILFLFLMGLLQFIDLNQGATRPLGPLIYKRMQSAKWVS